MMEVAERFAYKTDQFNTFGLQKASENELYCVASRSKAYILELIYSHHCDERIFMEQSTLDDISKFIPSYGVPKQSANIFNRATKEEQHRLLVDCHLMSEELKVSVERVALEHLRWSPLLKHIQTQCKYYLAYVTNFGGCEIRQKHTGKLSWCIKVHNVAREWLLCCQKNMKYAFNSFAPFEEAVLDIKITAIAWNNVVCDGTPARVQFSFATANGTIGFLDIDDDGLMTEEKMSEVHTHFHKKTNLKRINALEWCTFDVKRAKQRQSYMIACEMKGTISLLNVQCDPNNGHRVTDINELAVLCDVADGVCANGIQWEYLEQHNQLLVVACKGLNIFACLFSIDKQTTISSHFHYVGHLTLTGITRRKSLEYTVGTLSGHLECIHIKIENATTISIESEEMKPPNGHSKYALYGIANSSNNAFLLGAYFAGRPYDHLALREPGHIAVCHQLGGQNSLDLLLNSSTYQLGHMHDVCESVRNAQLRNEKIFQNYLTTYPNEVELTDEYLYLLKVRLIVTSARSTVLRQKNRMIESGNLLGEYNILKKLIFAIHSYTLLVRFNGKSMVKKLSAFQRLSAKCHRAALQDFINLCIFDEYEKIRSEFIQLIEKLLIATDKFTDDDKIIETCTYCDAPINRSTGLCSDEHEMPRCCMSLVQIPLNGQYQCSHCQLFALDDMAKLKQIVPTQNDHVPVCPLCDLPMKRPHLYFSDYCD